ncbi:CHRD domain-containing protein [Aliiglaciecola sp. CAU 1673]|uniref:CHRD domain-containing protein n=1 Tax=Aliiglaciecola sp. CAU 1673 TaxID=3032595 RepID=UPI0023DA29B5|nr:CHRD domain-containing protein [Aliiglaciecola sp. CAU 1673]MDF2179018.1 CHRD domain-containing protein [Aliiglaciecola sp. CAU 1673]
MNNKTIKLALATAVFTTVWGCSDDNTVSTEPAPPSVPTPISLQVSLNNEQQVPYVIAGLNADAELLLDTESNSLSGTLRLNGISAVGAHIHLGYAGENGPVLAAFAPGSSADEMLLANTVLDEAQLEALRDGALYINVHSQAYPQGAVRGQILMEGVEVFVFDLSSQQFGPHMLTPASGKGYVTLNDNDNTLTTRIYAESLTRSTMAHIHQGQPLQTGEPLVTLERSQAATNLWTLSELPVEQQVVDSVRSGTTYVNIHSEDFPNGELRGQVLPDSTDLFNFNLDALQLVPPQSIDASGHGYALVNHRDSQLTVEIGVTVPGDVVQAGIAKGEPGQTGETLLEMEVDAQKAGVFRLQAALNEQELNELEQGAWHINMSDGDNAPVLRGQLSKTPSSTGIWLDQRSMLPGSQTYSINWQGQPIGSARIDTSIVEGKVTITEVTDAPPFGVVETLQVEMDANSGAPLAYQGTGQSGERKIAIDLAWQANHLNGSSDLSPEALDQRLPARHIEQLGLFYSVKALPLAEGLIIPFTVYNALDMTTAERTLRVEGIETVSVAAGTFETFKVFLDGADVNQIFYISTQVPRQLIQIGFDAFPITYELQP